MLYSTDLSVVLRAALSFYVLLPFYFLPFLTTTHQCVVFAKNTSNRNKIKNNYIYSTFNPLVYSKKTSKVHILFKENKVFTERIF